MATASAALAVAREPGRVATAAPPPAARPRDAGRLLPRLPPPGRLRDLLAPLALTPRAARQDGWDGVGWSCKLSWLS